MPNVQKNLLARKKKNREGEDYAERDPTTVVTGNTGRDKQAKRQDSDRGKTDLRHVNYGILGGKGKKMCGKTGVRQRTPDGRTESRYRHAPPLSVSAEKKKPRGKEGARKDRLLKMCGLSVGGLAPTVDRMKRGFKMQGWENPSVSY